MAYKLVLPRFGMAMESAKVIKWKKEVGDFVNKEEAVLVVENEKLTNEIISMTSGLLLKKVARVGEKYLVGDVLAWLGAEGEVIEDEISAYATDGATAPAPSAPASAPSAPASSAPASSATPAPSAPTTNTTPSAAESEPERSSRIVASPLAKKLAAELGVDYTLVPGTGPGGRIDKEDVLNYVGSLKQTSSPTVRAPVASAMAVTEAALAAPTASAPAVSDETASATTASAGDFTVIPYAGMRKAIGEKMQKAWLEIPMVTHHVRVDASALLEHRKQHSDGLGSKNPQHNDAGSQHSDTGLQSGGKEHRLSLNDLLLKLTAAALIKKPAFNATFENNSTRIHKHVNLGIATALENGLIVPVIHNADEKSLAEISFEAKELKTAANAGLLTADNVTGGTFTVSNLGGYGSVDFFSPIINPPQVAILGVGRVVDMAVPVDGVVCIRPMMGLSLTYDHRAIDGATAAEFINEIMVMLEDPLPFLLH